MAVSHYALGTMTFGAETDELEAHAILDRYVAAGGTTLDMADVYADGESERIVGRWLNARAGVRDNLVLATKARFPLSDVDGEGLAPARLRSALEASLRRLDVDSVDLYQAHAWDPLVPPESWVPTMADFVRQGQVRAVGVSNVSGWQLQRIAGLLHAHGQPLASLQLQYNLLSREVEWELTPAAAASDVSLLPWSPLGGGWLTGKYQRGVRPAESTRLGEDPSRGVEAWQRRDTPATWTLLDELEAVAAELGASMAQVALAWISGRPGVATTILGVRTIEQLNDNLGALHMSLGEEHVSRLDAASRPSTPDYPYGLLDEFDRKRAP